MFDLFLIVQTPLENRRFSRLTPFTHHKDASLRVTSVVVKRSVINQATISSSANSDIHDDLLTQLSCGIIILEDNLNLFTMLKSAWS